MAQQKKKKVTKKTNTKKNSKNSFVINKQLSAIILFAVSILWFCLAIIDAGGIWGALRTLMFGLFGFCSFIFPLFLLIVALFIALDKIDNNVISKIIQATILITVISSIVHVAQCNYGNTYFEAIKDAFNFYYIDGSMLGGGVWGAIFGGFMLLITGGNKLAAMIILILLLFVFVMVITGLTLGGLFNGISKPVKKIGEITGEKISEYNEKAEQYAKERERKKKEFNLDIDLGPEPEKNAEPILNEKSLVDDDIIPFSNIKNEELFGNQKAEETESEENNVINLDEIINKNVEEPEQIKLDMGEGEESVAETEEYTDEIYAHCNGHSSGTAHHNVAGAAS